MGVFDKSICDCCVCPMQSVLEQLVGQIVGIVTPTFTDFVTLNQVKDFLAYTNIGIIPICEISVCSTFDPTIPVDIKKRIKKSKGECACCEDPITNIAKSLIGETVDIELLYPPGSSPFTDEIMDVGEGIVVGRFQIFTDFLSSCAITKIITTN
ncbi:hypothetical protein [Chengkuizengella axinellae]|uniref:Uncharacterized protein n=1 Tax=Chengkuizengella axinellae TaxID=3064388 RepID=A0ABT9J5R4_9BACL|nr:hypothetical protein [Chengkuizengella sp. 2205SS18-9]MDP5276345.1 hypothetical protein [Chengkuizengella sp. 2205SS18-9]